MPRLSKKDEPMPCPHCGEDRCPASCHQALSVRLADEVHDDPARRDVAVLRLEVAILRERIDHLTFELHQR